MPGTSVFCITPPIIVQRGYFEKSEIIMGLDLFSNIYLACLDNTSVCLDYPVKSRKISFIFGSIFFKYKGSLKRLN